MRFTGRWWWALLVACFTCTTSSAEETKRPNILFAISDDQSWMHAGAYGDKAIKTPAVDRVAREGVLFNYAYCAAPSCAPSRAAIVTGRHIWELEEGGNLFGILKAKFGAFTLNLQSSGYELGATGKTWGPGRLEGWGGKDSDGAYRASSTQAVFGQAYNSRKLSGNKLHVSGHDYAANFEDFLGKRDKSKPFFFWYGSTEPHQSYKNGSWKEAGKKLDEALLPGCIPDDPVTRGEFLDYAVEIEHFDTHLERMIKALEESGELENTLIVVTSDHGNPMPRSKCNLYDSGARVPLAFRWPGKFPANRKVDDFVNLVDLAPTLLEIAGVESKTPLSGKSLLPILTSEKSGRIEEERDFVVTAFERHIICRRDGLGYPMRSIRTHKYSYIRNYEPDRWPAGDPDFQSSHQGAYGDCDRGSSKTFILKNAEREDIKRYYELCFGHRPAEELYDMEKDPHQLNNLAENADMAEIKGKLASQMEAFLKKHDDPRMRGEAPWDTYEFTDKRIFKNPNWRTDGMKRASRTPQEKPAAEQKEREGAK